MLSPRAAELVAAVVAVVVLVSMRRRNEDLFLLALGYGRVRQIASAALPAFAAELLIGIAQRW